MLTNKFGIKLFYKVANQFKRYFPNLFNFFVRVEIISYFSGKKKKTKGIPGQLRVGLNPCHTGSPRARCSWGMKGIYQRADKITALPNP